ncbi:tetratricopeptide repeat protein [Campylobacter fetus]|uniref:tetratricopeptide repeat protein n=1 Tax=Campylobacter fetus TaxID=196 RepID=UPI001189AD7F|nr:tetratricopeptide repeat protein [Campylobacter fetus]QDS04363.1 tetratricopeptide repeat protein [Campylobacter fetus subsp. fetus]
MDFFFVEYRDPIFGLIVFFGALLLIAVLSYVWGIFSIKDEKHSIEKFVKKFENSSGLSEKHKKMLLELDVDTNSLSVLALTFAKSGDFDKAISVYLVAIDKSPGKKQREFLLVALGKIYLKAGFLKKASEVFLESLKLSPRNSEALRYLGVTYEKLRMYENSLETLDALNEQGADTKAEVAYIKALIITSKTSKFSEKVAQILSLSEDFPLLKRMVLEQFIKHNEPLDGLSMLRLDECIDIVFRLDNLLNLENTEFKELLGANGLSDDKPKDFNLALLRAANDNFLGATLSFSYFCTECKTSYPLFFYRCPNCARLGSVKILTHVIKDTSEEDMPF